MLKGRCICGAVKVEISGELEHQPEACHCSICRKQSGHFLVGVNVLRSNLVVTGGESVTWYQSSEKVSRGFCSKCGCALFWKPSLVNYNYTAVMMGIFEKPTGMSLSKHAFANDKGDYYEICDGLPQSEAY